MLIDYPRSRNQFHRCWYSSYLDTNVIRMWYYRCVQFSLNLTYTQIRIYFDKYLVIAALIVKLLSLFHFFIFIIYLPNHCLHQTFKIYHWISQYNLLMSSRMFGGTKVKSFGNTCVRTSVVQILTDEVIKWNNIVTNTGQICWHQKHSLRKQKPGKS